jgi:hypothetical protein
VRKVSLTLSPVKDTTGSVKSSEVKVRGLGDLRELGLSWWDRFVRRGSEED